MLQPACSRWRQVWLTIKSDPLEHFLVIVAMYVFRGFYFHLQLMSWISLRQVGVERNCVDI